MSQALYRKWRPSQWDQVVGQEHIITTLRNQVNAGRTGHAYLFAGPRGTGKTTTARLLAKALNCTHIDPVSRPCDACESCLAINKSAYLDLIEIDAASNNSVEDVRDLRDKIGFAPNQTGGVKVYIIDEVHMLSTPAFNALLKTLEEPPPHAVFILATTEISKIPATILSRCQRHEFRRLSVAEIVSLLQKITAQENLKVDDDALRMIARQASGAMRDAISLLDQLASGGEAIDLGRTMQVLGTAQSEVARDLVDAVLNRDPAAGLHTIQQALDAGADSRQLARQIVDYLRGLLLVRLGSGDQVDATVDMRQEMTRQAGVLSEARILEILSLFNPAAYAEKNSTWHPALQLEMAFAAAVTSPALVSARPTAPTPAPSSLPLGDTAPAFSGAAEPAAKQPIRPQPAAQPERVVTPPSPARPGVQPVAASRPQPPSHSAPSAGAPPALAAAHPASSAEPVAPAAPSQDPEAAHSMFQTVTQSWPKVRALIKRQSPQTEALLNSGRLLGIKDGVLVIALSPVLKNKLESDGRLEITVRAIQAVTGLPLTVRCTDTQSRPGGLPAGMQVEDDGIVGTALRDLGGEVVDIQ